MSPKPTTPIRRLKGTGLLAAFLLLTLVFSLWLGYQALDAARSHRRTAEGVLTDFAGIAVWEYSRRIEERLRAFSQGIFDDVPRTLRRQAPEPEVMDNDLRYALRDQNCRCSGFRQGTWYFRVDLRDSTTITYPRDSGPEIGGLLAETMARERAANLDSRESLVLLPAGSPFPEATAILYRATGWTEDERFLVYGMVARTAALEELFRLWYDQAPVLPTSLVASQPNDSLLEISVQDTLGAVLFRSPVGYMQAYFAQDTIAPGLGPLIIRAGIRPDAAGTLIIGGLPRSRLPLLLVLFTLTLGVGLAALLQIRREDRLLRLRDDFISSVSHEFRTPLTQIRLFSEILDSDKLTTEEERRRSTRVIHREAARLTNLVENILQFSEFQRTPTVAGGMESIELGPVLEGVTDAFLPQARDRGIHLWTVGATESCVMGRRGGIHRILANLLDNALKYGPDGQTVTVDVQAGSSGHVRLSVEDEGSGIAARDRRKIWEPYRRLERDIDGKVQGSGIGLSVVAELVHVFGGRAWVEDGKQGGARFVIELRQGVAEGENGDEHRGEA